MINNLAIFEKIMQKLDLRETFAIRWRASGKYDFLLSSRYENGAKQLRVH